MSTHIIKGFDYGELSSALIRRSEGDVRRLLGHSMEYIFEKGHHGQTPLHVSAYWPRGLAILFELANDACTSIIDATDSAGYTPLQFAIKWPNVESVAFLMKQNATIDLENMSVFIPQIDINHARPQWKGVCGLLTMALVPRRTEMLHYALENLPESEVVRLNLRNMKYLKDVAFEVRKSFKLYFGQPPAIFENVRPGSFYHGRYMDPILAQALLDAGFDNTDSLWKGYTPLMITPSRGLRHYVRLISWFDQKQANLFAVIPHISPVPSTDSPPSDLQFRVIHRLAGILGFATAFKDFEDHSRSFIHLQYMPLMRKILSKTSQDPCVCYCAPGGCNPISSYTKEWYRRHPRWLPENKKPFENLEIVLDVLSQEQDNNNKAAFVRVCTFNRLGMSHTCCVHTPSLLPNHPEARDPVESLHPLIVPKERVEVEEIQEEDRYLAETLEELMVEFQSRLRDRTQSFRDFWKVWNKRMNEVDKETQSISSENAETWAEIGVRVKA